MKKYSKTFTTEAQDILIRAQAPRADGDGFQALSFMRERVDYVTDLGNDVSGIVLKAGGKIPVAMPYDALEQKIYFADPGSDPVLDLRDVTGEVASTALFPDMAEDFAAAAPKKKDGDRPFEDITLKIAVFVRQSEEQNFKMFIFDDDDVDWSSVEAISGQNGKATKFTLANDYGPFDDDEIIIDMPRSQFMEMYNLAKMNGETQLDLRDLTRRRDPDKRPPGPKTRIG